MKRAVVGVSVALLMGASGVMAVSDAATAQSMNAVKRFSDATVGFSMKGSYSNYSLTVTGPNGFNATVMSKKSAPALNLRKLGIIDDGIYRYNLTAASSKAMSVRTPENSGRGGDKKTAMMAGVSDSGSFVVKGGKIVQEADISE